MSRATTVMAGLVLVTVPTIVYGGYFLLTMLMDPSSGYMDNPLRQNFFRAGHAHAGVIVILSLVVLNYIDAARFSEPTKWLLRISFPLSAILLSAGFFISTYPPDVRAPNGFVALIYAGALLLSLSLLTLAVGLLRRQEP
jgi:hypothetical protein